MSVVKLLSRIVAPSDLEFEENPSGGSRRTLNVEQNRIASTLHDHTYGITSDPLTQFACAFSALIHDADHTGVPNTQLLIENKTLSAQYQHRSVAEQNSLALSWDLLMDAGRFGLLRKALFATPEDLDRFRALVVNCVMATDIVDKDLKALRNKRWEKAFAQERANECGSDDHSIYSECPSVERNRKATIVIEHLIQASDVAHTMQHWHVYRKWNERLFEETYIAFKNGRAERNPADSWAKGEIGFFDFYIIPLAKKLKECGVFGVSSDEYLNYAVSNRKEWELRGEEIVATMIEKFGA